MPAAIKMIYVCPKCNEPMSSAGRPKKCPKCKFRFTNPDEKLATEFKWEKAPSRQLFELIQQDAEKALPKTAKELLPHLTKEQHDSLILSNQHKFLIVKAQWEKKRDDFFSMTEPDDVEEIVMCIHYLMRHCLSSGNMEMIKKCQVWDSELEKINEYLKPYVNHGGGIYARTDQTTKSGDSEGSNADIRRT